PRAVRERTRRPAAIADSNMRRNSGPAVPASMACSSAVRTWPWICASLTTSDCIPAAVAGRVSRLVPAVDVQRVHQRARAQPAVAGKQRRKFLA
ncbi:MAG: hypothetical protein QOJ57_1988, partial [Thermoleophilaceae bacterium]|nr:hypothetical protein [Thermoleophilaceae bacterium]